MSRFVKFFMAQVVLQGIMECAKLHALHAFGPYVTTCSRALRACLPSCLCFVRAFHFLTRLTCLYFFTCLTCLISFFFSRALRVLIVLRALRALIFLRALYYLVQVAHSSQFWLVMDCSKFFLKEVETHKARQKFETLKKVKARKACKT